MKISRDTIAGAHALAPTPIAWPGKRTHTQLQRRARAVAPGKRTRAQSLVTGALAR